MATSEKVEVATAPEKDGAKTPETTPEQSGKQSTIPGGAPSIIANIRERATKLFARFGRKSTTGEERPADATGTGCAGRMSRYFRATMGRMKRPLGMFKVCFKLIFRFFRI